MYQYQGVISYRRQMPLRLRKGRLPVSGGTPKSLIHQGNSTDGAYLGGRLATHARTSEASQPTRRGPEPALPRKKALRDVVVDRRSRQAGSRNDGPDAPQLILYQGVDVRPYTAGWIIHRCFSRSWSRPRRPSHGAPDLLVGSPTRPLSWLRLCGRTCPSAPAC